MNSKKSRKAVHTGSRFKRFLFPVLFLFIVKIVLIISEIAEVDIFSLFEKHPKAVSAQQAEDPATTNPAEQSGAQTGDFQWSYELVREIKKREAAVAAKEQALRLEEQRLTALKQDIENKIEQLLEIQSNVSELVKTQKQIEEEQLFKLAKVFEETPPEQAGPLFSKLDDEIAAQLLLKMRGRSAGRIWGFVDPEKAVSISREIARLKPDYNISNMTNNQ